MARILFLAFRIAVFGLFVICNAVQCIVGALDLNIAEAAKVNHQGDVLAVLIGVAGLLLMFPILLFEVLRRKAAWNRVWFEIAWLSIFSILYMSSSIFLTLTMDTQMCYPAVKNLFNDACTTTRVLIAFSWLGTIVVFQYLVMLATCAYLHKEDDSSIWSVEVPRFPWFASRWLPDQSLPNTPLPFFHGQREKSPMPEKRRPTPSYINWNRGGLGSGYLVEPYRAPTSRGSSRTASRASSTPPKPPPKSKKWLLRLSPSRAARAELEAGASSYHVETPVARLLEPVESRSSVGPTPSFAEWPTLQIPEPARQPPSRPQLVISHAHSGSFPSDISSASLPPTHTFGAPPASPLIPSPSRRPRGPRRPSVGLEEALRVPPVTWSPASRTAPHRPPLLTLDTFAHGPNPTVP